LDIGYDTYAFLINRAGSVLVRPGMDAKDTRWDTTYRTDNLLTTDNVAFNRIIEKMIKQESGISHYKAKGDTKIISYAPIKAISASMAIVASMDEVIGPAIAIRNIIAVVFVIILIISIGIAIFIGNSIIGPINELTMQANLISMGECNLEVLEIDRKDEIGVLTQSFNRLVISLKMALSRI
jgi:methyl-accepting chemotaxis protein